MRGMELVNMPSLHVVCANLYSPTLYYHVTRIFFIYTQKEMAQLHDNINYSNRYCNTTYEDTHYKQAITNKEFHGEIQVLELSIDNNLHILC